MPTTITIPTMTGIIHGGVYDTFDIDVGSGTDWTRIATGVASGQCQQGKVVTTWSCPGTSILFTDRVRITLRGIDVNGVVDYTASAMSDVLGMNKLDSAVWTFTRTFEDIGGGDYEYYSDVVVTNIVSSSVSAALTFCLSDTLGRPITRIAVEDGTCEVQGSSGWITVATGLALATIHDLELDTHAWTVSVNGGTSVAFDPLVDPVTPIGELCIDHVTGVGMFGQISYE